MRIVSLLAVCLLVAAALHAEGPAPSDTARFKALMRKAHPFFETDPDSANYYLLQARALAVANHNRQEYADAGVQLGNYFRSKGDYTAVMPYFTEARAIYDSLHDWLGQGNCAMCTALLYKDISARNRNPMLINQAIDQAIQAYGFFSSGHDTARMCNALNTQGIIYRDKAKTKEFASYYDTAYARYLLALDLVNRSGKGKDMLGMFYNNISQIFLEYKNDPRGTIRYLRLAQDFNRARNNRAALTYNDNNFSEAYLALGKVDSAIYYARDMLAISTELDLADRRYDSYDQLYVCFDQDKRYDSALHYYKAAMDLNDSMTNLAKTKEVVALQEKYNGVKKEMDIKTLNAENSAKNKEIAFLVVVLTFLVVLVAGFSYLVARLRAQKRQIADQSVRLEVMLRELHHRVKNNLQIVSSLLGLQRYKSEDAAAISVLQESQDRVQAMSLIHQRLYKNDALSSVNIREYLVDLCESLLSSYGYDRDRFELDISVCTDVLDIDQALPIGLIVNELVTNAFKYAYPGVGRPALRISLEQDHRNLVLVVRDNGVGIDEERWRQGKDSFGKQLIGALCKQLRATQQMAALAGAGVGAAGTGAAGMAGTEITITIPKEAAA